MKASLQETLGKKIIDPSRLKEKIAALRREGKTIATLNGSFDLLHAGHLEILYQASCAADVLIVLLNTDASIQAYKNPDRPFIPLEFRTQMMAAIEFVDYVSWFSELDPRRVLEEIKPDVHVNGSEYGAHCIEADVVKKNGGTLQIVELVPGLSTTAIVKKIRQTAS